MKKYPITDVNRVKRLPKRGSYDVETVHAIVDAGLICHVGFVMDGRPMMIPTLHARRGNEILLHGASTSRMLKMAQTGIPLCISVTHVDGIVLARSVFHHSMNYRSVVLYGNGYLINDYQEKWDALETFTDKLIPGRWNDSRQPTPNEMKATTIIAMPIDMASAKVRTGDPGDDAEDYELPIWAGVVPMTTTYGTPIADPLLRDGIPVPEYVTQMVAENQP